MKRADYIGIDAAGPQLLCQRLDATGGLEVRRFDNEEAGYGDIVGWATGEGRCARVCVSAGGLAGMELALCLLRAPGIELSVVHPWTLMDFARRLANRNRVTAPEAGLILEYLCCTPFVSWCPVAPEMLELNVLTWRMLLIKADMLRASYRSPAETTEASMEALESRFTALQHRVLALVDDRSRPRCDDRRLEPHQEIHRIEPSIPPIRISQNPTFDAL